MQKSEDWNKIIIRLKKKLKPARVITVVVMKKTMSIDILMKEFIEFLTIIVKSGRFKRV